MRRCLAILAVVSLAESAHAQPKKESRVFSVPLIVVGSATTTVGAAALTGSIVFAGPVLWDWKHQDACYAARSCFEAETAMAVTFVALSTVLTVAGISMIVVGARRDPIASLSVTGNGLALRF